MESKKSSDLPSYAFRRVEGQDKLQSASFEKTRLTYDLWEESVDEVPGFTGVRNLLQNYCLTLGTNLYCQSLWFEEQPLASDNCEEKWLGKRHLSFIDM